MFSFENLKVYQRSVEFLAVAARIIAGMPRGSGFLVDQRKRASLSIAATIAEGAGRPGDADERRHFGIARGSAMESVVLLDACRIYGYADGTLLTEGRADIPCLRASAYPVVKADQRRQLLTRQVITDEAVRAYLAILLREAVLLGV